MSVPEPSIRIEIVQRSQRCLVYGVISVLPLLAMPFWMLKQTFVFPAILHILALPLAALALSQYWRVKRRGGNEWNPARPYLRWGCFLGSWGAGFSSLAAVVLGFMIASQQG